MADVGVAHKLFKKKTKKNKKKITLQIFDKPPQLKLSIPSHVPAQP